jgi:hypothetical protein
MPGILKRLKGSVLADTIKTVRQSKPLLFLTMLFDLLFIISLFGINLLLNMIFPNPQELLYGAAAQIATLLLLLFLYMFLLIIVYSLFKFLILHSVKQMFSRSKIDFSLFGRFFALNIFMLGTAFLIALFVSAAFGTLMGINALTIIRNILFAMLGLLLYLFVNTSHSLFAQGEHKISKILNATGDRVFSRLLGYSGILFFTIIAFFILSGIYYLFDWLLILLIGPAMQNTIVYWVYAVVNTISLFILFDMLLAFNRVYFYRIAMKDKS